MQPFRLTSFFILILLLGTVVAAACTNDDRASTVAETPPPAAPTPDVEAIVETAVREMLEAIPTPAPALTPDIEAIVETVLQRTTGTMLETLVAGLSNYLKMARRHCRRNHRSAHASCNTPR